MTLIDVSVVVVILAVLACLLLPALSTARKTAQRINCVGNLMQIGLGFRIWEGDHTNLYPMSISTNFGGTLECVARSETFRHFQVVSNELSTPKVLVCPADVRQPAKDFGSTFANTNISYFLNLDTADAYPQMILAGDDNLAVNGIRVRPGILNLSTNTSVEWTMERHHSAGNLGLVDGSVQTTTINAMQQAFQNTGVATNRLAIP